MSLPSWAIGCYQVRPIYLGQGYCNPLKQSRGVPVSRADAASVEPPGLCRRIKSSSVPLVDM